MIVKRREIEEAQEVDEVDQSAVAVLHLALGEGYTPSLFSRKVQ
jgi:hypothetical protein